MKILCNGRMPKAIHDPIAEEFEFICPQTEETDFTDEEMKKLIEDVDAILVLRVRKIKNDWLDAAKQLKVIGCVSVGFDNVDVAYAKEKGIAVVHTPNAVREATAEMALTLMLTAARGIVPYNNELKKTLACGGINWFFDRDLMLCGKTLGIVGFGRIGRSLAMKAKGIGMNIVYYDPYPMPENMEKEFGVTRMDFDELLKTSDVVSLHMPYCPDTHHLMDDRAFALMKAHSYLVNTARGAIVDEAALIRALQSKKIRGAALDVFEFEPNVSQELSKLENCVIVPHVGTMLLEVRRDMVLESLSGIRAVFSGKVPQNLVRV